MQKQQPTGQIPYGKARSKIEEIFGSKIYSPNQIYRPLPFSRFT